MNDAFDVGPLKNLGACNAGFHQERESGQGHYFYDGRPNHFSSARG
jgi:hypothetical protein